MHPPLKMKKPVVIPAIVAAIIAYKVGCDFQDRGQTEKINKNVESAVSLDSTLNKFQLPKNFNMMDLYSADEKTLDSFAKIADHDLNLINKNYDSGNTDSTNKKKN